MNNLEPDVIMSTSLLLYKNQTSSYDLNKFRWHRYLYNATICPVLSKVIEFHTQGYALDDNPEVDVTLESKGDRSETSEDRTISCVSFGEFAVLIGHTVISSVTRLGKILPFRLLFTEPIFTQRSSFNSLFVWRFQR